jgi:hypothetical protein
MHMGKGALGEQPFPGTSSYRTFGQHLGERTTVVGVKAVSEVIKKVAKALSAHTSVPASSAGSRASQNGSLGGHSLLLTSKSHWGK